MASRGGTASFRCPTEGCTEAGHYTYTSNADYARLVQDQRRHPWMCTRHRNPEQVLSPSNPTRTIVLTAEKSKRFPNLTRLFWRQDDEDDVGSGFMFGPGFKAHADDFPEGSRLVITIAADLVQSPADPKGDAS